MGLWNFVKNAGKSLIGSAEASEAPPEDALRKEVEDLGLNADGLEISVDGDKVTVSGNAVDQETREKVILAVGNVEGVASVEDNAKSGDGADPAGFALRGGLVLEAIYGLLQIEIPATNIFAHINHAAEAVIIRNQRCEMGVKGIFDSLCDFNLALAGEQRNLPHLSQVDTNGIRWTFFVSGGRLAPRCNPGRLCLFRGGSIIGRNRTRKGNVILAKDRENPV